MTRSSHLRNGNSERRSMLKNGMDQERFGAGAVANGGTKDSIITARMRNVRAGKWRHAATKGPRPAPCTLGPTVWNVQDGRSNHILGCCTHLLRVWLRPVRHLMSVRPQCQECHSQSRFYVTTPSDDGSPAVGKFPKLSPRQPLQVLRSACGLTESPRLWSLRARGRLTGPETLTELRCARAVLTKNDSAGKLRVILTSARGRWFVFGKTIQSDAPEDSEAHIRTARHQKLARSGRSKESGFSGLTVETCS